MHGATASSVPLPALLITLGLWLTNASYGPSGTETQGFVRPRGRFWKATETSVSPTHWQVGLTGT